MKRFKGIWFFLLGVLLTLFIFHIYPLSLHVIITSPLIEVVVALGTLGAVVAALVIAVWGDWLKRLGGFKSDLLLPDSKVLINDQPYGNIVERHVRLLFINNGEATAEDVEVYISKIKENDGERGGFLPVPLSWTHWGGTRRNFHPLQFGYIDFCKVKNKSDTAIKPKLVLAAGAGVDTYETIFYQNTTFELIVFQKSGQVMCFELSLEWIKTDSHDFRVKSIKQVKLNKKMGVLS
jgi:hypothetical protein